jgi:Lipocalin-like domain
MLKRALIVLALAALFLLPTHTRIVSAAADNPLEGVCQVMDVGGQPAAGMYIFTGKHYSMMFATTDRPQIDDTSKATADELRAMWGPMAANAGTYDVSGNLVTIKPIVAKIPVVMKPGANEVYAFRVEGNMLSLTQQRNARGVTVQNAATTRLMRVE